MKRVLIFTLLTLTAVVTSSCKNDDFDKNEWREFRLMDKWTKVLTIHYDADNNVIKTEIPVQTGCPTTTLAFLEDKIVSETSFQKTGSDCQKTTSNIGSWELTNNNVTIRNNKTNQATTYSIRKLNALDLELESSIYNANATENLRKIRVLEQYIKVR
ncbi:MAG: hypothetical protein LBI72_06970 [Flavobacteriaceae bacterium]|jgi:hypothetical protein|nr:hypothetical protein [Flavobacteriaceae bacterium]